MSVRYSVTVRALAQHNDWKQGNSYPGSVQSFKNMSTINVLFNLITNRNVKGGVTCWKFQFIHPSGTSVSSISNLSSSSRREGKQALFPKLLNCSFNPTQLTQLDLTLRLLRSWMLNLVSVCVLCLHRKGSRVNWTCVEYDFHVIDLCRDAFHSSCEHFFCILVQPVAQCRCCHRHGAAKHAAFMMRGQLYTWAVVCQQQILHCV